MLDGADNTMGRDEEARETVEVGHLGTQNDFADSSLDDIFGMLSHSRRRYVVDALAIQPGWSLEGLTEAVATIEATERSDGGSANLDAIRASLCHVHLPKLRNFGALTFDPEAKQIERAEHAGQLIEFLEAIRGVVTDV